MIKDRGFLAIRPRSAGDRPYDEVIRNGLSDSP